MKNLMSKIVENINNLGYRSNNQNKREKGSITLYVLVSMMFFLSVTAGIYVNSSNKVQKQEKETIKINIHIGFRPVKDVCRSLHCC